MSFRNLTGWIGGVGGALALLLAHPAIAAAQCIMCYLSAGSSGESGSQVLRLGILVLAVPVLVVFAGLFLFAYRRRNPAEWDEASQGAIQLDRRSLPALSADHQDHSPFLS